MDEYNFYLDKYNYTKKLYNVKHVNTTTNKFLYEYELLNPYSIYPYSIKLDINLKCNKIKYNLYDDELHKLKTEYLLLLKNVYESSTNKLRRFFSYEIVDKLKNIMVNDTYITNAWLKLYETYSNFDDLLKNINNPKIFCICEHPGAFIYASKDYFKLKYNKDIEFKFQSLKPNKDKQIFKLQDNLLYKYRDNLDYGETGTGDITDIKNIKHYANKYKNYPDIITSDCGLDCSDDFSSQENNLVFLFYSAFLTAKKYIIKYNQY